MSGTVVSETTPVLPISNASEIALAESGKSTMAKMSVSPYAKWKLSIFPPTDSTADFTAWFGTEQRLPNEAFEMSYSIGAVMYEWILGTYGLDGFIKILNQLATAKSFDEALQKSVGLTQNEFYVKSAGYVFSVFQSTWPYR